MAIAPNLTYTITYTKPGYSEGAWGKTETIPLSGTVKMSTATGFSTINVKFMSDISLSKYYCYITVQGEEYGIGIGKCAYYCLGSMAANVNHAYTISVNTTNFSRGDTTYRVSMYAQNAADLTWDSTTFLLTTTGAQVADSTGKLLEVYEQGDSDVLVYQSATDQVAVTNVPNVAQTGNTLEIG